MAAKATTTTVPIVFNISGDPVELGLVASLNRPGGNLTGVTSLGGEVAQKRLELLHELLPTATIVALLVNPTSPVLAESTTKTLLTAARTLGLQLYVLQASTEAGFDIVFAKVRQLQASALVISNDAFFSSRIELLAALAKHLLPNLDLDEILHLLGGGRWPALRQPGDAHLHEIVRCELNPIGSLIGVREWMQHSIAHEKHKADQDEMQNWLAQQSSHQRPTRQPRFARHG